MAEHSDEYVYELERQLTRTSNMLKRAYDVARDGYSRAEASTATKADFGYLAGVLEATHEIIRPDEPLNEDEELPERPRKKKKNILDNFKV